MIGDIYKGFIYFLFENKWKQWLKEEVDEHTDHHERRQVPADHHEQPVLADHDELQKLHGRCIAFRLLSNSCLNSCTTSSYGFYCRL